LGKIKIGRYICSLYRNSPEEERGFWGKMKTEFFEVLERIYQF
jgi:hypothetical protein